MPLRVLSGALVFDAALAGCQRGVGTSATQGGTHRPSDGSLANRR